ncbi:hypothetical protein TESG_00544 [Trichophyton tonsurans CBS 112818]|uniref:Uncharacterized protein n=1 Tax=Trichophyton tonsurans (strain CBS 112818) TaxID=647933 RepID=F2RNS6_TRIT1|nr:hypothetical protein TESG_00544 [Trichophyton tonsurans CBS 112818]
MPQPSAELLSALQILCDTPPESLRAIRGLDTWKRVKVAINSIDDDADTYSESESDLLHSSPSCVSSPSIISSQSQQSSSTILPVSPSSVTPISRVRSSRSNSQHNSQKKTKAQCLAFLDMVKDVLAKVVSISYKYPTLEEMSPETELSMEKRTLFLRVVYGSKSPSERNLLLLGLSQISHALDYSNWEAENLIRRRVDEICSNLSMVNRRGGNITRYTNEKTSEHKDIVLRGIRDGLNKLTFAKLFRGKLKSANATNPDRAIDPDHQAEELADAVMGILPVLSLTYPKFRLLKYDQYPGVIDALLLEGGMVDTVKGLSKWVRELISTFQSPYQRSTGFLLELLHTQPATAHKIPNSRLDTNNATEAFSHHSLEDQPRIHNASATHQPTSPHTVQMYERASNLQDNLGDSNTEIVSASQRSIPLPDNGSDDDGIVASSGAPSSSHSPRNNESTQSVDAGVAVELAHANNKRPFPANDAHNTRTAPNQENQASSEIRGAAIFGQGDDFDVPHFDAAIFGQGDDFDAPRFDAAAFGQVDDFNVPPIDAIMFGQGGGFDVR